MIKRYEQFHNWLTSSPRFMFYMNAVAAVCWLTQMFAWMVLEMHFMFWVSVAGMIVAYLGLWAWGEKVPAKHERKFRVIKRADGGLIVLEDNPTGGVSVRGVLE